MAKLFEKIDDNPGEYFGMLVEGYEDLAYDDEVPGYEPKKRTWADKRYDELMNKGKDNWGQDDWDSYNYIMQVWGESGEFDESLKESIEDTVSKILSKEVSQPKSFKWLSNNGTSGEVEYNGTKYAFRKLDNGKYKVMPSSKAGWNWSETLFKDESLKEDKFVSKDKMSKKAQKELNDKKRGTWGNTNPVTKVQPNKKAYDRKRDKKELDENIDGINLTEEQLNNINTTLDRMRDTSVMLKNDINKGYISKKDFSNVIWFFENSAKSLKDLLK